MRKLLVPVLAVFAMLLAVVVAPTADAAYPGSNGKIAFVRSNQIFTMQSNGSGQTQLTSRGKNSQPRWSPDGQRIAYISQEKLTGQHDLWVMDADGSHKQKLTQLGNAQGASWSPDGKWLAFGSPLQRVRAVAPFGPPQTLGARGEGDCCADQPWSTVGPVAWSEDGDHIAFVSHEFPDSPDTYLLEYSLAHHTLNELGAIGGSCCGEGTFADPFYGPAGNGPFYTIDESPSDGQPLDLPPQFQVQLADASFFPSKPYDQQGAISPDNHAIAFMNNANGKAHVFVENLDGTSRQRLTLGSSPDWQPTSTVPWVKPPPADPDTLAPLLVFNSPATFPVGQQVSASNLFDTATSNDYTVAPVRMSWHGSDPESGICGYDVAQSFWGQADQPILTNTTATKYVGVGNNRPYNSTTTTGYDITAHDCAGNQITGNWWTHLNVVDDSGTGPDASPSNNLTFNGSWAVSHYTGWSGGTTHKTTQYGDSASITVTGGADVGIVMAKGPDRGQAEILLNGQVVTTVDTYDANGQARIIVANVQTPANTYDNTIEVVNLATPGRSRIDVDAYVITN